jgi:putative transposase
MLYNTALEQRIFLWKQRGVTISQYEQDVELKDLRAAMSEYAAIHSHVLQDILARLNKTYQAFFRRVKEGQTPGFPRFQGRERYHSFTYKEYGNGARLDNGFLVLSKIGRVALRWSRPLEGTPKTVTISREADGWYVIISCAEAPVAPLEPTGQETGIDLGLESFATLSDGTMIHNPRCYRRAERRLKRPSGACHAARKAVTAVRKQ